ncbi:MAG: type IV pilus modification protein PilV [Methylococcales bacterium]|nr:type IV pilus modification protein PilV [Methylococcales bacterium]
MFDSRGFTLIEVLISMVILAIGLLGLAAMQGISLRDNQDAYNYQQATLLAYEMQDRIKGNSDANWTTVTIGTGDCTQAAPCDSQTMANNDYGYWKRSVEATLPIPKIGNSVEIKSSVGMNNAGCKGTYPTSLCLITRWARTNNKDTNKASKLSDTATYYLEVTP